MKLEWTARFAVAGILLLSRVAFGAETFVACPVQQLEASVTTQLPGGWWATPQQGGLINTEVATIAGKPRLVCNYRVFQAKVPIMSEIPKGYSVCKAAQGGFRCGAQGVAKGDGSVRIKDPKSALNPATQASAGVPVVNTDSYEVDAPIGANAPVMEDAGTGYDMATQSSTPAPAAAGGASGAAAIVDPAAARNQVEKFIKKQASGGGKTASARICGDPAAVGLGLKQGSISSTPTKDPEVNVYAFRIEGEVKNVAETALSSSGALQSVEVYEVQGTSKPRLVQSLPFESLAAGESLMIGTDIPKWTLRSKVVPDYELRISFSADECSGKNNVAKLRGSDINNALLRGNYEAANDIIRP